MKTASRYRASAQNLTAASAAVLLAAALLLSCAPGGPPSGEDPTMGGGSNSPTSPPISESLAGTLIRYYEPARGTGTESGGRYSGGSQPESDEPFTMVDYGPVGELPADVEKPSVFVVFSQPVVPLAMLGAPVRETDLLSIDPPLSGTYRWYGTKLLSFDADDDALPQREYTVTLSDRIESLGGKPLTGRRSFSFRTEPLSLDGWFLGDGAAGGFAEDLPEDVPVEKAGRITLLFSYPVDPGVIGSSIRIESSGASYPFTVSRPDPGAGLLRKEETNRAIRLAVTQPLPENSEVRIVIAADARAREGYIGTPQEIVRTFTTLRPFAFLHHDTASWAFPRSPQGDANPIFLTFSHPVDTEGLAGKIRVEPSLPIDPENIESWGDTVKLNNLPVEHERSYTFRLDPSIRDIHGRSLGRERLVRVDIGPPSRYAHFPNTGTRMLEAQFPPKIVWEMQNVFDGVWKVDRIEDPYRSFPASTLVPYDFSSIPPNVRHFEVLDLSPWLNEEGKGTVGISWNFAERDETGRRPIWGKRDLQLQVTDIGLTTRFGYDRAVVLVTSLSTGKPIEGASVRLAAERRIGASAVTDGRGLAAIHFEPGEYRRLFGDSSRRDIDRLRILVERGKDRIEFIPNDSHNIWHHGIYSFSAPVRAEEARMETFMFTDRGLYRPGETVTFRGIDRNLTLGRYSPYVGSYSVTVKEAGYRGRTLHTSGGATSGSGGFHGSFPVDAAAEPGTYVIEYRRGGESRQITYQVAHFERLSFQADVSAPDVDLYHGDTLSFRLAARYLSGGPLAGGSYRVFWIKEPASFRPSGKQWQDYRFGPEAVDQRYVVSETEGELGPEGEAAFSQPTTPEGITGLPYEYRLEASVRDAALREVSARNRVLVHPASFYIGAKLENGGAGWGSPFVAKGSEASVRWILVGPDGSEAPSGAIEDEVRLSLYRVSWKTAQQEGVYGRINTRWERIEELEAERTVPAAASGSFAVTPRESGQYFIRIEAKDAEGRTAVTRLSFYATGSDWITWGGAGSGDIELEADKPLYSPGDTARILVKSPLPEGDYLITVERESVIDERVVHLTGSAQLIEVPVEKRHVPVVYVAVSSYSVRSGPPSHSYFEPDLDRPKGYFGIVPLAVDTSSRTIDLSIRPGAVSYRPGGEAEVTITARSGGKPAAGVEITFMAVDRGVIDLIDYHVPDPMKFFYSHDKFPLMVRGADSRSLLIDPVTYEVKDLHGGGGDDEKMSRRKDFRPTAVFEPYLVTDSDGKAVVRFTLPDSLTAYRLTAVAVGDDRFGIAENEIRVSNPLEARTALPRKLRLRDTARAGVTVTNLHADEQEVTVSVVSDSLAVDGEATLTDRIPSGETRLFPFRLAATEAGPAQLLFTVESEVLREELQAELEVERPYIYESFATTGRIPGDESAAEEGVAIPSRAPEGTGSLELVLDATRLARAASAVEYLIGYPYGCLEQKTAGLIPLVLLGDHLDELGIPNAPADPAAVVRRELGLIGRSQNADGGFPYWPGGRFSSYYVSLRTAHLLALARDRGYEVPQEIRLPDLLSYLRTPPEAVRQDTYLRLYGLYVRSLHGERVEEEAAAWLRRGDEAGLSGYAFLGLAYLHLGDAPAAGRILIRIRNFLRPGTRSVDITETREASRGGLLYDSQVEQLSLLLLLYNRLRPDDEMITRIANTLFDRQRDGLWRNTIDSQWAVIALADLARTAENESPAFTARAALDGIPLAEGEFTGLGSGSVTARIPFSDGRISHIPRDSVRSLRLEKEGPGTLYYAAALRYALPSELLVPRDEGLGIHTEIMDRDGTRIADDRLEPGRTYRMRTFVTSTRHRSYVALRLPVPSGAEILDTSFVTTARVPRQENGDGRSAESGDGSAGPRTPQLPAERQILDNEIRIFFDEFPPGKEEIEFLFRTHTEGIYPTPPPTAECMYEPEVFGRGAGTIYLIRPKE